MTFDFFNASNLAFGAKLTGAFTQLENLADAAESNLERVYYNASIMEDYNGRNYLVARPTDGSRPCRTDEIFNLIDDMKYRIETLKYENGKLKVKLRMFTKANSRITVAEGSTSIKKGFAFCKMAGSNSKVDREITFVEDAHEGNGDLLFEYRIDNKGIININGYDVANLGLIPCDCTQYKSLSKGATATSGGSYTAEEYECLCIVGNPNDISVKLNGTEILKGKGNACTRHCILYVKPEDKVEGTFSRIFKIEYNQ